MNLQQIKEELEALRVDMGRHMIALGSMTPRERNNAIVCDMARMRDIAGKLERLRK